MKQQNEVIPVTKQIFLTNSLTSFVASKNDITHISVLVVKISVLTYNFVFRFLAMLAADVNIIKNKTNSMGKRRKITVLTVLTNIQ